jgi:hypothetical protein
MRNIVHNYFPRPRSASSIVPIQIFPLPRGRGSGWGCKALKSLPLTQPLPLKEEWYLWMDTRYTRQYTMNEFVLNRRPPAHRSKQIQFCIAFAKLIQLCTIQKTKPASPTELTSHIISNCYNLNRHRSFAWHMDCSIENTILQSPSTNDTEWVRGTPWTWFQ